jgi:hypothetical protein
MTMYRRRAVIVLGMHRSGTSAVAGTAVRLGLAPPRRMLPPSPDNPAGFYEPVSVSALNDLLLNAVGCSWHDCLSLDLDQFHDEAVAQAFDMTAGIVREEYGDAPAFVLKDPRLCLTLPVWLPALRAAGAEVAVLLVIRHPVEVMRSLFRRDQLPDSAAAPLWLHHMLEAERNTRALPRAVIGYDDLLRDWRGCMMRAGRAAGIAWPSGANHDRPDIDAYLDTSFRHHVAVREPAAIGPPPIRGLIDVAWSALGKLRDDPGAAFPLEWLDQVHRTFAGRRRTGCRCD